MDSCAFDTADDADSDSVSGMWARARRALRTTRIPTSCAATWIRALLTLRTTRTPTTRVRSMRATMWTPTRCAASSTLALAMPRTTQMLTHHERRRG